MATKQEILSEIKRTATANGGVPLGIARFERETGLKSYDWERFWPRFGDAQKEAGFLPNELQAGFSQEAVIQRLAEIARKLGKFPTFREIEVERTADSSLPTKKVFQRIGSRGQLAKLLMDYCTEHLEFSDVVVHCNGVLNDSSTAKESGGSGINIGEVYLLKSGRYFKIGRTNDFVRRGREIRIQLPEKMILIHSIKTDDPAGIEAYWHNRFQNRRMQGEWFDLTTDDVKAFKRWRRIM